MTLGLLKGQVEDIRTGIDQLGEMLDGFRRLPRLTAAKAGVELARISAAMSKLLAGPWPGAELPPFDAPDVRKGGTSKK